MHPMHHTNSINATMTTFDLNHQQRQHGLPQGSRGTTTRSSSERHLFFPAKLYDMLEDAERKSFDRIVSWAPSGAGFKIHNPKAFAKSVLPEYFRQQTRYRSFTKQLNLYMFKMCTYNEKIPLGDHLDNGTGSYYAHPSFVRGQRDKCLRMTRRKVPTKKTESEDHFHREASQRWAKNQKSNASLGFHLAVRLTYYNTEERLKEGIETTSSSKEHVVNSVAADLFASPDANHQQGGEGDDSHHCCAYQSSCYNDKDDEFLYPLHQTSLSSPSKADRREGAPFCSSQAGVAMLASQRRTAGGIPQNLMGRSSLVGVEQELHSNFSSGRGEQEYEMPVACDDPNSEKSNIDVTIIDTTLGGTVLQTPQRKTRNVSPSCSSSSCPSRKYNTELSSSAWFEYQEELLLDYAREVVANTIGCEDRERVN